jgi:hypothetical protein
MRMAGVGGSRRRASGDDEKRHHQGREKGKHIGQPDHPKPFLLSANPASVGT